MDRMAFKEIDMDSYPRLEHFLHFMEMDNPLFSLTVQVDITDWLARTKELGRPFFLSFLYEVGRAANAVVELRQRIHDGRIVQYDECRSSYTVALEDGTYRYCNVSTDLPFDEYLSEAKAAQERAVKAARLEESEDPEGCLFISCLPWLSYSDLQMPHPGNGFSNPSITWGKYYKEYGKVKIPVTIMVNHAIVDGLHVARFFSNLGGRLSRREDLRLNGDLKETPCSYSQP